MFRKVLIANRGEIACRVIRTCRALGVATVAVYSDPDRDEPHVRAADEAVRLGPASAAESYLAIERIVDAALRTEAEAIHPGYGFLAENPDFAEAVVSKGLTFIGPRPETMRLMSDKAAAKSHLQEAGVPTIPGVYDPDLGNDELADASAELGFPVLIKPVAGGGGKGMRRVDDRDDFAEEADAARREAEASFGDDRLLVEKLVERPRHIEFQVFGDSHGNVMHLFERECSIQRRHQKIVEESPSPALDEELRERMAEAAVDTARSVDYLGAGTVEMLLSDETKDFYFLEMNTRLQVEHPVTELITGLDLVEWQLRVAAGEPLPLKVDEVPREGHAIEVRVYAEDPARDFLPQAGRVLAFEAPTGPGLRVDVGVAAGSAVGVHYDPMIAKLIVHGEDRHSAISRLSWALRRLVALGVTTNIAFLHDVVTAEPFVAGRLTTHFLEEHFPDWSTPEPEPRVLAAAAAALLPPEAADDSSPDPWGSLGPWRLARMGGWPVRLRDAHDTEHDLVVVGRGAELVVEAVTGGQEASARRDDGAGRRVSVRREVSVRSAPGGSGRGDHGPRVSMPQTIPAEPDVPSARVMQLSLDGYETAAHTVVSGNDVWVHVDGQTARLRLLPATRHLDPGAAVAGRALEAPMPGEVAAVNVSAGDEVDAGDVLVVVEAMKMEHQVRAPVAGTVAEVHVAVGDSVDSGTPLIGLEPDEPDGAEEET